MQVPGPLSRFHDSEGEVPGNLHCNSSLGDSNVHSTLRLDEVALEASLILQYHLGCSVSQL